jgi:hypothetical protein
MNFAILFLGAVLGAIVVLLVQGRRDEQAAARDWAPLLTPRRAVVLSDAKGQLHDGLALADVAFDRAQTLHELGSVAEAQELLRVGYQMIDKFAPDLTKLLAMMTVYSRMVSAVTPVRPLRAERFRTTSVSVLVRLGGLIHHVLATSVERFRFRLFVIGQSVRLLLNGLAHATMRLIHPQPVDDAQTFDADWQQIRDAQADLHILSDESLESLRVLLSSLDARRSDELQDHYQG